MSGKDTKNTATIAENGALAKDRRGFPVRKIFFVLLILLVLCTAALLVANMFIDSYFDGGSYYRRTRFRTRTACRGKGREGAAGTGAGRGDRRKEQNGKHPAPRPGHGGGDRPHRRPVDRRTGEQAHGGRAGEAAGP